MSFVKWRRSLAGFWLAALVAMPLPGSSAEAVKPVIAGFIDMQTIAWHNQDDGRPQFTLENIKHFPGMFGGIVLNATWAEMQPTQRGPLITERIDAALNAVHRYNAAHPDAPLGVKLRIFSGNQAPPWAKALAGGPLTIQRNQQGCPSGNCPITIGKVWDRQYIAAWRAFQGLAANRYDSHPLIRSVAITSCTMETDEPFVMPTMQPVPPGYTDAAGKACLRGAVDDYAPWRQTAIDFTFNVFVGIENGTTNLNFSKAVMAACRADLGTRCEIGNHALSSQMGAKNTQMVAAISAQGAPIHYQTAGPRSSGFDWAGTMRAARRYNATAVELWPDAQFGGFMSLTRPQMRQFKAIFNR